MVSSGNHLEPVPCEAANALDLEKHLFRGGIAEVLEELDTEHAKDRAERIRLPPIPGASALLVLVLRVDQGLLHGGITSAGRYRQIPPPIVLCSEAS